MDQTIRDTLCGFVEDMYGRMRFDRQASRRDLMVAAERLAGSPDAPKTHAGAILRFMDENGIALNGHPNRKSCEDADRADVEEYAETCGDQTISHMQQLDEDLGGCIDHIRKNGQMLRHIDARTKYTVSRALRRLRADNERVFGWPGRAGAMTTLGEMEALHAENAATLKAFAENDRLPGLLSSDTRNSLFLAMNMVNTSHLRILMYAAGMIIEQTGA